MAIFINIDDFVGRYRLAVSTYNKEDFNSYLDQVVRQTLTYDFDTSFYDEAINDHSKSKFQDLLNNGYKDYLITTSYFYYQRDAFLHTSSGNVKINNSNSVNVPNPMNGAIASDRYNLGVNFFNNKSLPFLNENSNYKIEITNTSDISIGVKRLTAVGIKYLYAGDLVKINGLDYEVISIDNSSSTIDVYSTESLTGYYVTYEPFNKNLFCEKKIITPF